MDKIILVYQSDYPWDIRIEKFLISLSKNNEVHLLCRNKKKDILFEQINENIFIHRFPYNKLKLISEPFHLNLIWQRFILRKIDEIQPKTIIVRDLPLAKCVIKIAKQKGIESIFDNAENYPEFIRFFSKYNNVIFKLLNKINYFEKLENYCVSNSSKTINVIEQNTDRISKKIGNKDKMINIYNVPYKMENYHPKPLQEDIIICYIGSLGDDLLRGVSTIIKALKYTKPFIKLKILGDGRDKSSLEKLVINLNLSNRVEFLGNIIYSDIKNYANTYDIGIVSHIRNNMTDTTMANKIYEYMAYGLYVIATDAIPLKKFVEENHIGLVYKSGDEKDLADKINEAINNRDLMYEVRKKNVKLHLDKFNWEQEEKKLIQLINKNT